MIFSARLSATIFSAASLFRRLPPLDGGRGERASSAFPRRRSISLSIVSPSSATASDGTKPGAFGNLRVRWHAGRVPRPGELVERDRRLGVDGEVRSVRAVANRELRQCLVRGDLRARDRRVEPSLVAEHDAELGQRRIGRRGHLGRERPDDLPLDRRPAPEGSLALGLSKVRDVAKRDRTCGA